MRSVRTWSCGLVALAIGASTLAFVGTAAAASPTQTPKGQPIKVMTLGEFNSPTTGFVTPESPAAVQARAKDINAHGGIDGRPVQVLVCNSAGDANTAMNCAREAVSQHVVAVTYLAIAPFEETAVYPILQQAGIPAIGSEVLGALSGTSPISFPLTNTLGTTSGVAGLFVAQGAKKIAGMIPSNAQGQFTSTVFKAGLVAAGATAGPIVFVDAGAIDLAPYVAEASAPGVTGIYAGAEGPQEGTLIKEIHARGFTGKVGTSTFGITNSLIQNLGKDANGLLLSGQVAPATSNAPGVKMFRADMNQYAKKFAQNENSLTAWLAMWTFERVAKTLPSVTPAAVLSAMSKLQNFPMGGITPPLTTTKPGPLPGVPGVTRVFNPTVTYSEIKNGKAVAIDNEFHNPYTGKAISG